MKITEGPIICESYKEEDPIGWLVSSINLPADIEEQIANYDLHHPILAHHKTCKCFRCVK